MNFSFNNERKSIMVLIIMNSNKKQKISHDYKNRICSFIYNERQKAKKEAPSRPHKGYNLANARMVPRWG